ncbi:MAG TPA: 2-dehydropantoate 2-reductase, partial [Allocoleopsis sp.]
PACDVVVVTLKTTQNHLLRSILPTLLKPDGVVLVLQNGLGIEAEIANLVGDDRVLGGVCFICTTRFGPGYIRHFYYDLITLADYRTGYASAGLSQRMHRIAADLEGAGFLVHLAEDLLLARWQKLVCDLPFSALSVVLNATIRQIMANPYAQHLVEQIMQEVIAVAASQGCKIAEDYIQKRLISVAKIGMYRTCMKVDYDEKRSMELEAIIGNPLRIAQQVGVNTPQIAMLYQQLKYLDVCNQLRGTRFALAS